MKPSLLAIRLFFLGILFGFGGFLVWGWAIQGRMKTAMVMGAMCGIAGVVKGIVGYLLMTDEERRRLRRRPRL